MKLDTQQRKIIDELTYKHKLEKEQIIEIIQLPFKFIKKEIVEIELTGYETQEEFHEKTKNFNIPAIGKLYADYNNFKKVNYVRRREKIQNNRGNEEVS